MGCSSAGALGQRQLVLSQAVAPCRAPGSVAPELSSAPPAGAAPEHALPVDGHCLPGPQSVFQRWGHGAPRTACPVSPFLRHWGCWRGAQLGIFGCLEDWQQPLPARQSQGPGPAQSCSWQGESAGTSPKVSGGHGTQPCPPCMGGSPGYPKKGCGGCSEGTDPIRGAGLSSHPWTS